MMLTVFWDAHGVVLLDFAAKSVKINSDYYVEPLTKVKRIRRKPNGLPFWIQHDNAPIHKALITKEEIEIRAWWS